MDKNNFYEKLNDDVYVFTNEYYYSERVNTYLIKDNDTLILFDIPDYSKEKHDWIKSFNAKKICFILSHGSCGVSEGLKWKKALDVEIYLHEKDINHPWLDLPKEKVKLFNNSFVLSDNVKVIHTPGHSKGSICLFYEKYNILFSGDTFGGTKDGLVRDFTNGTPPSYEDREERISSCVALLQYDFNIVYPFHYLAIKNKGCERLKEFLKSKKRI